MHVERTTDGCSECVVIQVVPHIILHNRMVVIAHVGMHVLSLTKHEVYFE
jgi:hypothetical protein